MKNCHQSSDRKIKRFELLHEEKGKKNKDSHLSQSQNDVVTHYRWAEYVLWRNIWNVADVRRTLIQLP